MAGALVVHGLPAHRYLTTLDDEERLIYTALAVAADKQRERWNIDLANRIVKGLGG